MVEILRMSKGGAGNGPNQHGADAADDQAEATASEAGVPGGKPAAVRAGGAGESMPAPHIRAKGMRTVDVASDKFDRFARDVCHQLSGGHTVVADRFFD